MIEMINTSASSVEIGKNVKIGDGEPLEFCRGEKREEGDECEFETCASLEDRKVERFANPENFELRKPRKVFHISETDDRASAPPELRTVIMGKLEHLVKAEREVLGPVMMEYFDLFLYDRSGSLPCTGKGLHEIKTGDALPIKKNPYKVPFALRAEMKTVR